MPPEEHEKARKNDSIILQILKSLEGGQVKLFRLVEEQGKKWQELHESFALCQQNGNHETERVNEKIKQLAKIDEDNFQKLSERIAKSSPESQAEKEEEAYNRRIKRLQSAWWIVKIVGGALVFLLVIAFIGGATLQQKGWIRVTPEAKIEINTNG